MFFLSHCVTLFFHFDGMPIHHIKVSSRDPFSTVLYGKASVFQGPFFYGIESESCTDCITYTARVSCVDYAAYSTCSASNDLLSFPHINNSRPRYGESSKGPKTPPPPYPPPSRQVLTPHITGLPTISRYCACTLSWYPQNCSGCVILTSPNITHTCWSWHHAGIAIRKALSGRNCHHIRPAYSAHSRTVLCHIDMGRITPYMPYHYIPSEKSKR